MSRNDKASPAPVGGWLDEDQQRVCTPESSTPTSFRQWCEEVLQPAVTS